MQRRFAHSTHFCPLEELIALRLRSEFKCVAVSNPSVARARIDQLEPAAPRVGDVVQATASGSGTPPLQFAWDFGDGGTLAYGGQAAHVYTAAGSYRVTLTHLMSINRKAFALCPWPLIAQAEIRGRQWQTESPRNGC